MSHVELVGSLSPPVVSMAVSELRRSSSFREGGLCAEQVDRFVALAGSWPPVLVHRADGTVIDGAHRIAAARRLGLARVDVVLFDGTQDEAFIEFVRRNVAQGLMLTLGERKRAAARVLQGHPHWSDRRIAELCALSPKTVGRLRVTLPRCPDEEGLHSDEEMREGRDHRLRPVRREPVRARVVEALRAQPEASLRTIAAAVGVSPETVRLVRLNLASVPVDEDEGADEVGAPASAEAGPAVADLDPWRADAALASSDDGSDFVEWFERTAIVGSDLDRVATVPLSRVYEISDEARRRADAWMKFARSIEARPARDRS